MEELSPTATITATSLAFKIAVPRSRNEHYYHLIQSYAEPKMFMLEYFTNLRMRVGTIRQATYSGMVSGNWARKMTSKSPVPPGKTRTNQAEIRNWFPYGASFSYMARIRFSAPEGFLEVLICCEIVGTM